MTKFLLIGAATIALGGAAFAQMAPAEAKRGWGESFTRADTEARAREMFGKRDTNRDGFVTKEEIRAAAEARMGERREAAFDRLDADNNGQVSRDEFTRAGTERRERLVERRMERREGAATGDRKQMRMMVTKDGGPGQYGPRRGLRGGVMMLAMTDADNDGRISQAEALDATMKRFDAADANKDGTLTPEERRGAMSAWGNKMRAWGGRMRGMTGDMPPPPPAPVG